MKKIILLAVCVTGLFISGCGADHPFTRGEILDPDGNIIDPGKKEITVSREVFENTVLPKLNSDCARCHANKTPTYEVALSFIVIGKPEESKLYQKATGDGHPPRWSVDSPEAQMLAEWIKGE